MFFYEIYILAVTGFRFANQSKPRATTNGFRFSSSISYGGLLLNYRFHVETFKKKLQKKTTQKKLILCSWIDKSLPLRLYIMLHYKPFLILLANLSGNHTNCWQLFHINIGKRLQFFPFSKMVNLHCLFKQYYIIIIMWFLFVVPNQLCFYVNVLNLIEWLNVHSFDCIFIIKNYFYESLALWTHGELIKFTIIFRFVFIYFLSVKCDKWLCYCLNVCCFIVFNG